MAAVRPKKTFQILSAYLDSKDKWNVALILFLLIIASFLEVFGLATLIPVIQIAMDPAIIQEKSYIKPVYDFFNFQSANAFLLFLVVGIFIFFLFKNLFMLGIRYKQLVFIKGLSLKINKKQFEKYYSLDYWMFNKVGVSSVLNHVNRIPEVVGGNYLQNYFQVFTESFVITTIVLAIAIYQPVLFMLMVFVLGPVTWLIYSKLKGKAHEFGNRMDSLMPEGYSMINDAFRGYADLKLNAKEELFLDRYYSNREKFYRLKVWSNMLNDLPIKAIEMIAIAGVVLIFLYSLFMSSSPDQIFVLLGIFVAASYRIMPSVNRILSSMMTIKNFQFSIDSLELHKDYIKRLNTERHANQSDLKFNDSIEFRGICYTYPDGDNNQLKDINFTVFKGQKIGFMGQSGSGKTTLMNILLRFYEETSGFILVDGIPLNHEYLKSWRSMVGYVRQDVFIMNGSIEDNITLCDTQADRQRLEFSVDLASLREVVNELKDGLSTQVGENGARLSGGQKQRIGIARAIYHKAKILVFDEATSALDHETEKEITKAINKLSETDITLFIIAHRITTLKDCDKIFELRDGEIIAEHTYTELTESINE